MSGGSEKPHHTKNASRPGDAALAYVRFKAGETAEKQAIREFRRARSRTSGSPAVPRFVVFFPMPVTGKVQNSATQRSRHRG